MQGPLLLGVPDLATAGTLTQVTIIGLLDSRLAIPFREAEQSITATVASPTLAHHLGRDIGDPLPRIDPAYLSEDGYPIELAVNHFDPRRCSYRVRLRRAKG